MDIPFRITLAVLMVAFIFHRGYYTRKYASDEAPALQRSSPVAKRVTAVLAGLFPLIRTEEALLLERYGERYRALQAKTGRLLPKIGE